MKRRSTEGRRWAVMARYDIPDLLDETDTYLTRWRILQTPWFGLYLHAIRRPDRDRHLHDHPWPFASIILRGGYTEAYLDRWGQLCTRHVRGLNLKSAAAFHAIVRLHRQPVWTLMAVGRRERDWGYLVAGTWVDHDTYHRTRRDIEAAKAVSDA